MHRALDQRAVEIEKLMLDPIERRPGMRAAIDVGKTFVVTPDDEAIYVAAVTFQRKSVGTGIGDALQWAN